MGSAELARSPRSQSLPTREEIRDAIPRFSGVDFEDFTFEFYDRVPEDRHPEFLHILHANVDYDDVLDVVFHKS